MSEATFDPDRDLGWEYRILGNIGVRLTSYEPIHERLTLRVLDKRDQRRVTVPLAWWQQTVALGLATRESGWPMGGTR